MANSLIEKVRSIGNRLEIEIWSDDLQHAIDGHPEVTLDKVTESLKDPTRVIQSKKSKTVCLFYSVEIRLFKNDCLYFCVVVTVTKPGKGKMVTAYETDFIKTGIELYSKK